MLDTLCDTKLQLCLQADLLNNNHDQLASGAACLLSCVVAENPFSYCFSLRAAVSASCLALDACAHLFLRALTAPG